MPLCTPTSNALYIFQSGTFPSCNIFPGETFHNNICGIRLFLENLFLQSGGFFYCATVNQLDKEAYHNAKNFQKGFWSPQVICSSITHKKERKLPFSVLCTVRSWEFLGVLPKHCYIHNNTSKKKKIAAYPRSAWYERGEASEGLIGKLWIVRPSVCLSS